LDAPEVLTALLEVVGQVADLGVFGLAVEVLQQETRARALGVSGCALQALDARLAPRRVVAGKGVAAVDDDPLGSEAAVQVDVGAEILLGSLGQERRRLRDVHRGGRMQAQMDTVAFAEGAHRRHTVRRPRGGSVGMVGRALQAHVDVVNAVGGCPGGAVLETPPTAESDADAVGERHGTLTRGQTRHREAAPPCPGSVRGGCSGSEARACARPRVRATSGGRAPPHPGSPRGGAIADLSAGIIGNFWNTPRITSRRACWASASAARHMSKRRAIGPGWTLAVALMQPAPPLRMFWSKKGSDPAKTSKPDFANASRNAFVLVHSPPLSFIPAIWVG